VIFADCLCSFADCFDTKTIAFVALPMSFDVETISQLSGTMFFTIGRLFSSSRQYFWNQAAFLRSGNDHLRSETDLSITEKISGALPTIFFATKQIILRENYNDSNGIRIAIMRQSAEQLVATAGLANNPVFQLR
jgi:hypothetical protein